MGELQDAGAVGHAVLHAGDPRHVLLVVRAGTGHERGVPSEHAGDGPPQRPGDRRVLGRPGGLHDQQVPQVVAEVVQLPFQAVQELHDLLAGRLEPLLDEEATVEHRPAAIRHAGRLDGVRGLAAMDGVHVQGGLPGALGDHGHLRLPPREGGQEIPADGVEHRAHVLDGARAQERHAPVSDPPVRGDLEPVDAPVADADAVHVEGLGDDDRVGPAPGHATLLGQPGHPGPAAALLVHGARDLYRAGQAHARPADRFGGVDRRRDPRLHVGGPAAVDAPVPHLPSEGVHRPTLPHGDHVEVTVQVHQRIGAGSRTRPHHVDPRVGGRVLGTALGLEILHVEAEALQPVSDDPGALLVQLARRVHRGDPHQLPGEVHRLVRQVVHGGEDAVHHARGRVGGGHGPISRFGIRRPPGGPGARPGGRGSVPPAAGRWPWPSPGTWRARSRSPRP